MLHMPHWICSEARAGSDICNMHLETLAGPRYDHADDAGSWLLRETWVQRQSPSRRT